MKTQYYRIPSEDWYRIHFVRPRFKANIERVLLYMAKECCRIPSLPCQEYNKRYLGAIKAYPGNVSMADKTLHNWRTEIPALFGFYTEDKVADMTHTSSMAWFLNEHQDLTQFLRLFLASFQFPGGHLKPKDVKSLISAGVRFKPAQMIIRVLLAGDRQLRESGRTDKRMTLSAEEVTYCIFNDLRVLRGDRSAEEIASLVLSNRKNKYKYYDKADPNVLSLTGKPRSKGDVTRYAGDILDYMVLAKLLDSKRGYYYLKGGEESVLYQFAQDESFFSGYDSYYRQEEISVAALSKEEPAWFAYVNDTLDPDRFRTKLETILNKEIELDVVFDQRVVDLLADENRTKKDIGNLGEAIVCGHERMRLKLSGYEEFIKMVQIVDSPTYHPGFDIDSFEADGTDNHRYIEVKTTISSREIDLFGFHMSPNEWSVASTIKEHYCIYRLMLSDKQKTLIVLRDPVSLYKQDHISGTLGKGIDLSFDPIHFPTTELLVWQE